MADWVTISSLSTAGGTLVLAVATFASVRSGRRAAVATEKALLAGIRPVLVPSRPHDPPERVGFADNHRVEVGGGRAVAEATDEAIYFAIALRNVGNGLAVLDRWDFRPERVVGDVGRPSPGAFRRLTRDLYVPAGDVGYWQGTYRDRSDPSFEAARDAIAQRRIVTVDLPTATTREVSARSPGSP
ncbi:MAG: hypothetical protein M3066_13675 [Actinomycetota bacterium]|nr:hypothetical protein [Actinomycetota bacterium]